MSQILTRDACLGFLPPLRAVAPTTVRPISPSLRPRPGFLLTVGQAPRRPRRRCLSACRSAGIRNLPGTSTTADRRRGPSDFDGFTSAPPVRHVHTFVDQVTTLAPVVAWTMAPRPGRRACRVRPGYRGSGPVPSRRPRRGIPPAQRENVGPFGVLPPVGGAGRGRPGWRDREASRSRGTVWFVPVLDDGEV